MQEHQQLRILVLLIATVIFPRMKTNTSNHIWTRQNSWKHNSNCCEEKWAAFLSTGMFVSFLCEGMVVERCIESFFVVKPSHTSRPSFLPSEVTSDSQTPNSRDHLMQLVVIVEWIRWSETGQYLRYFRGVGTAWKLPKWRPRTLGQSFIARRHTLQVNRCL